MMTISTIGMQTHVYVAIFLMWTSNHANIILCVYVRFTFKRNVDCLMYGLYLDDVREQVHRLPTRRVSST